MLIGCERPYLRRHSARKFLPQRRIIREEHGEQQLNHEHDDDHDVPERASEAQAPSHSGDPARLASTIGNRAFGAMLGRVGEGILPDGTAHPDVEATIAKTRGSGTSSTPPRASATRRRSATRSDDVRVHTDETADQLARSVSARAFTTGSDVFFAKGEHQPGSSGGDQLLTHELAHVVQQRDAPTTGPMTVSMPGDALETEAEAIADEHGPEPISFAALTALVRSSVEVVAGTEPDPVDPFRGLYLSDQAAVRLASGDDDDELDARLDTAAALLG